MNSKYYTRKGIEELYNKLCSELRLECNGVSCLSDYALLVGINGLLHNLNLIPLSEEELEMELN